MLEGFSNDDLWLIANIAGVVVIVAVGILLTILVMLVRTIEHRVLSVRDRLEQAVGTTSDSALIAETAAAVDAVLSEGLEHHLFLGRVLDPTA